MESGHEATALWRMDDALEGTNAVSDDEMPQAQAKEHQKAQDWQSVLSAILESYQEAVHEGVTIDMGAKHTRT